MDSRTRLYAYAAAVLLSHALSGCQKESQEPSAAQRAVDEVQAKYEELLKDKVDVPLDWATDDLENIGDWEYRVVRISYDSTDDLEAQLNELGNERWESDLAGQVAWRVPRGPEEARDQLSQQDTHTLARPRS